MTKVIYAPLNEGKPSPGAVKTKKVKTPDGQVITVHTVNADSRTFSTDLTYVFEKNVAKAKRENKRIMKSAGRCPGKA
jgi:hypothetical protein